MKTILLPTDFSPHAHNAFIYALNLAEHFGASLLLFHSYHYTNTGSLFIPPELIDRLNLDEKENAQAELEKYTQKAQVELGKNVAVSHVLTQGFAVDEILDIAAKRNIDLIVMGTQGAASTQGRVFGSVTASVIEKAPCPVLAIPESYTWQGIRHIAYATNFEENDLRMPEELPGIAHLFEAHISCVHINQEPPDGWARLQQFFREELFRLEINPDQMELFILDNPDVLEGLNTFIQNNKVDMLAMLTHKRGFLERILQKSMTRKMSHASHVPLLAFHK